MGAAPRRLCTTALVAAVAGFIALGVASVASAQAKASNLRVAQLPSHVWAVDVTSVPLPQQAFLMSRVAAGGANALVIKDGQLPPWVMQALRAQAGNVKLPILSPFTPRFVPGHSLAKSTQLLCARQRAKDRSPCAVIAKDALHARLLASAPGVDVVVIYSRKADAMRAMVGRRFRNRIVVIAPDAASTTAAMWKQHVTAAKTNPSAGLGVTISGDGSGLTRFLSALPVKSIASTEPIPTSPPNSSGGGSTSTPGAPSATAPGGSAPAGSTTAGSNPSSSTALSVPALRLVSASDTSVTLAWTAVPGASSYAASVNAAGPVTVTGTSNTFSSLACNMAYTVSVQAIGPTGSRSASASMSVQTNACASTPVPAGPVATAPPVVATVPSAGSDAYVSVSGSDAGSCSSAAPCASFARAYQVVSPGGTVQVQGGSYPDQLIPYSLAKPAGSHCDAESGDVSGCITFKPAPNASVTLASFRTEAPYVQLQDMTLTGGFMIGGGPLTRSYTCSSIQAHDDIVRHVTSTDAFYFEGATHSALIDSTFTIGDAYRPTGVVSQFSPCSDGTSTTVNDHLLIDGVTMRDLLMTHASNLPGCTSWQCMHLECIHLNQANNTTIRNSQFLNCAGHDIYVESNGTAGGMNGLLFENNIFDSPCSHQSAPCNNQGGGLQIDCRVPEGPISNVTIRFNTFNGFAPAWSSEGGCHFAGTQLVLGNVGSMTSYACSAYTALGSSYAYNVWDGTNCSNTDQNAPSNYTDPGNYNFHLLANATALGFVPATQAHPSVYQDGGSRGSGNLDAGALGSG